MDIVIGVATAIACLVVLWLLYLYHSKRMKKKDAEINELLVAIKNLQDKLKDKERRKAFRVKLLEHKCTIEFVNFGDPALEKLLHRKSEGIVKDVSRTGVKLVCPFDLPVRKDITLILQFMIHEEEFTFKGKVVRKEEHSEEITYGIRFIEVNVKDQQRLIQVLQQLELERRKSI
ncbi:hypothetical protein PAE9249_03896 [Paenibacillus sp. CECT 9249]|uniref:PilZ domain-containing protein n=1 Tax=Paenibacillus sp. CECT 9249 TaxID=2845385 RepID=UPI001E347611|nr:PilZ domain-containing protein [Paenibacillus sp. CECT 9249]CAH0121368.1 hypothetical protein PAE9249_03896 [Paenibacillus sp. CECT 9249]